MNTLRLYGRSMAILIKSQLQYPLSFLMQTIAQLVMEGGEMLALILLIDRFDRLNQWGPGDLYFFFGLMSVSFYLTEIFGRGVTGNFPYMVRTGQLDTVLLRPRGVLTQVLCSAADPRRITCIAVGVVSLVLGSNLSKIAWTLPKVLLPSTTALATLHPQGRLRGILAGANVIMPNLSPIDLRDNYTLYDNKANTGLEAVEGVALLDKELSSIGCHVVVDRGDARY